MAIVPELKEPSSSLKPSTGLISFSTSNTHAKLDPWLHSSNNQVIPAETLPATVDDPLQEIIPDGLMLKVIPEQNDSPFPVSSAQSNSPGSEKIREGATDLKRKNPVVTNHNRPRTQKEPKRRRLP
jgi:hypothetical protein